MSGDIEYETGEPMRRPFTWFQALAEEMARVFPNDPDRNYYNAPNPGTSEAHKIERRMLRAAWLAALAAGSEKP